MLNERILKVIQKMREAGIPRILISSPGSVFYLTGLWIEPAERMLVLYLDINGKMTLFGNELFAIDNGNVNFECVLHKDSEDPVQALASAIESDIDSEDPDRNGVHTVKLGVDKFWPAKFLLSLLEKRPDITLVPGSSPVDHARMQKDAAEIGLMKKASKLNDQAMAAVIDQIQNNITEIGLVSFLSDTYLQLGADFPIGILNASFGKNASDPHHSPEQIHLTKPGCVLFDIFTPVSHYWCDMTRTVFYKDVNTEERKIYETVKLANEEAIKKVCAGVPLSEIDKTARDVIAEAGYGAFFTHRLGHGIGIDCHEPPDVSENSEQIAKPGMIFSIEPGIYLPGKTGVRIEDLVLVTETGCEVLNQYPKDLQVVG